MNYPKILPFKGLRYNADKISDLSAVVSPPYDVIHSEMQEELYQRSPYNFVRVDLTKEEGEKRYQIAKEVFDQWKEASILTLEDQPCFYFHHQTFTLPDGKQVTRKGFFAARRIEDFSEGGIKPHEKTLEGPKKDRLQLTRALQANLSPIFSLYSDPEKKIDQWVAAIKQSPPLVSFTTIEGEKHEIWKVEDKEIGGNINQYLTQQPLFIADGHHRFETALNYRNECRRLNPPGDGMEPFNYVLMYLSNLDDRGLIVLPIHRALHHLKNFNLENFIEKVSPYFEIEKTPNRESPELLSKLSQLGEKAHAFAVITPDDGQTFLMSLKKDEWQKTPEASGLHSTLAALDVSVLHRFVFEKILDISLEAQANQSNIIYWKDTQRAIQETRKGACQVTFLLNSTPIQGMKSVAIAGEKMPQKSTFFYPKILSGLVINPLI